MESEGENAKVAKQEKGSGLMHFVPKYILPGISKYDKVMVK